MVVRFGVVVLGVSDRDRAAAFWQEAIHYRRRTDGFGGWAVVLEPPDGHGARIALQLSQTPLTAQPRSHLDLHVDSAEEQRAEVDRLLALGARRVDWADYPDDPDFVVLADTEGNVFCVVDLAHDA